MGILGNGRYDRAHIEESTVRLSKQGGEREEDKTETRRAAAVASGCVHARPPLLRYGRGCATSPPSRLSPACAGVDWES